MPGPVSVTLTLNWPLTALAVTRTSPQSVNLMALPTRLSSTCVRRCSSPRPMGSDLATSVLSASFLFCARDSVAERTVSTTLSIAYSDVFSCELTGLDLGDVEHGIDEAQEVFAIGADAGEGIEGLLPERFVEAFLHELSVTKNCGKWRPQLMA